MSTISDSPLSITASIAGILTFLVAIVAALYVRLKYLRDADTEYFQVKASLSWYKTESTWMKDLINSSPDEGKSTPNSSTSTISGGRSAIEHEMYAFVMDQLGKLEERLLELLTEAEDAANKQNEKGKEDERWTIVPEGWRGRTGIAMTWLPVRAKALELVRQRDALASRVLFAQMSMISSKVREQESKSRKRELAAQEKLDRMELVVVAQNAKLDNLEDLVYRMMHRSRVSPGKDTEYSPRRQDTALTLVEGERPHKQKPEMLSKFYGIHQSEPT